MEDMKKQLLPILVLALIIMLVSPLGGPSVARAQANTTLINQLKAEVVRLQAILQTLLQGTKSSIVTQISVEPLTLIEITEVRGIKEALSKSNGHDYLSLYRAIDSRRGDLKRITRLCAEFDPVFCYKWASKENPSIRSNLCQAMSHSIEQKYGGRVSTESLKTSIANHQRECQIGIPQFGR